MRRAKVMPYRDNSREECVQMPKKMAISAYTAAVWASGKAHEGSSVADAGTQKRKSAACR